MKKFLFCIFTFIAFSAHYQTAKAQVGDLETLIYGSSSFQDSLWGFDTTQAFLATRRIAPSLAGFWFTGMNGLAFDPCSFQTYGIAKLNGVSGRVLVTIDLKTGVCAQIGNLGDNFSSLTFDRNGQLYGTTGDGATIPETFWAIDKTNASKTMLFAMGNGADGEIICYHPVENTMYHWSGNSTPVFEKFPLILYAATNIPYVGGLPGEVFGALYLSPTDFLISTTNTNFRHLSTSGNLGPALSLSSDDPRGLVMLPSFSLDDDTICPGDSIVMDAFGAHIFNTIIAWGDGAIDTVVNTGASHVFNSAGNYTITVILDNGYCVPDTFTTFQIRVNTKPVVGLTGNEALCPGATNIITGSSGGQSQWYFNGAAIPGADTNFFAANIPGTYNMTKTNLNGCTDSSAVSFVLYDVPNPVVNLGPDTAVCGGILLDAGNPGSTYLWSTLDTGQTLWADVSDIYHVALSDTNGCSGSDTISVTVHPLPAVTYSEVTDTVCIDALPVILTPGSPLGGTYIGPGTSGNTFDPAMAGTGSHLVIYEYTDLNSCTSRDSSVILVDACTGTGEAAELQPGLSPNPVSDRMILSYPSHMNGRWIEITNAFGERVLMAEAVRSENIIDLSMLAPGV